MIEVAEVNGRMRIPQSKITVPELPSASVPREDLVERLDRAVLGQLVVVIAPPGFGKTTLLASWLRGRGGARVAWGSLESADDAARFRSALLAALVAVPDLASDSPLRRVGRGGGDG